MGANAKIIVDPSSSLSFNTGTKVFSCESMWYGIEAQSNNTGYSATITLLNNSTIEDAYTSINADNASVNEHNKIISTQSTLNKNYIDIKISNTSVITDHYPLTVNSSTLQSQASATSPGNSLKCSSFYTPSVKARSYAGLYTSSAGIINFTNPSPPAGVNVIQNKDYGLYFSSTDANVYNATFSDAIGSQDNSFGSFPNVPKGVGIYSTNSNFLNLNDESSNEKKFAH